VEALRAHLEVAEVLVGFGKMRVSPFSSIVKRKCSDTRAGVPSGRFHGFQPSFGKPKIVSRPQRPIVSIPRAWRTGSSTSARSWNGSSMRTGSSGRPRAFRTRA
jgi:hypothetical protein